MKHAAMFLTVCAMAVMVGCGPKTVNIRGVEGASKTVAGVKRLAVLNLAYADKDSSIGRDVANLVVAALDQTGAFDVMERSAMSKLLEEKDLTLAMSGDAAAASSIGKILKVDGVVVGEVTAYSTGSSILSKKAAVGVNLRLVDVKTAKVAVSFSQTKNYGKFLGGDRPEYVLNQLADEIAKEFVAKIAPHYVERPKYLLPASGDVGKINAVGVTMAVNGLWDKAQEQFEMTVKADNSCAAAHNNLAVCLENAGKLGEAMQEYETALKMNPESEYIQRNLVSARDTLTGPMTTAKEALEKTRRDVVAPTTQTQPSE